MNKKKLINTTVKKNSKLLALMLITIVITTILGLLYPMFGAKVLDAIIYENHINFAIKYSMGFIILFILHQIFHYFRTKLYIELQKKISINLKLKIVNKIFKLCGKNLMNYKTGDLLLIINEDSEQVVDYLYYNVFYSIADIIEFIFQLVFIAILNFYLFLFTLFCVPLSFILTNLVKKYMTKFFDSDKNQKVVFYNFLYEIIYGKEQYQCSLDLNNLIKKEREINLQYNNINHIREKNELKSNLLIDGIKTMINISLYLLCAILIFSGNLTLGAFLAIIEYFMATMEVFTNIASRGKLIAKNGISFDRLINLINSNEENEKDGIYLHNKISMITIDNCCFSYNEELILKNICLNICEGTKIAIIGESGSGKSTFAYLISGLLHPNKGLIKINNTNINNINIKSLRNKIGILHQETILINNSIRFNITLGKKVDEEVIKELISDLDLYDLINNLPDGIDTKISYAGSEFSGGQRQRIALARLILKNPDVIILDEYTSSLDSKTEKKITEAISKWLKEKMVIIISHRKSTILKADQIYKINKKVLRSYNENKE